jgi:hypothetical protein
MAMKKMPGVKNLVNGCIFIKLILDTLIPYLFTNKTLNKYIEQNLSIIKIDV